MNRYCATDIENNISKYESLLCLMMFAYLFPVSGSEKLLSLFFNFCEYFLSLMILIVSVRIKITSYFASFLIFNKFIIVFESYLNVE